MSLTDGNDRPDHPGRSATGQRSWGVDYDAGGERYDRNRGRTIRTVAYRDPVRRDLADAPAGAVLDVGSGTGTWSTELATWSGRHVVAVEPSRGMRAVARTNRPHDGSTVPDTGGTDAGPTVHLVGGRGAAVPLRDGTAGAAWLSTVIHHVGDLGVCARELRRVLRPGAPVLIRSAFPGRYDGIPLVRFFPPTRRVLDRFPSVDAVRSAFADAGFEFVRLEPVDEPPEDLRTWRERLAERARRRHAPGCARRRRVHGGLRAVDAAIAAGRDAGPVALDLLVLR